MKTVKEFFVDQWNRQKDVLAPAIQRIMEDTNEYLQQYWFAEQLYQWLSKRNPDFIQELWEKWMELTERRSKAEAAMGKSSEEDGSSQEPKTTTSSTTSSSTQISSGVGNS
jgi:hypothetical protein